MTPAQIKLAAKAVVFAAAAYDQVAASRMRKRCKKVMEESAVHLEMNRILIEECTKLNNTVADFAKREAYLLALLTEHNIPVTEFDLIVLNELT